MAEARLTHTSWGLPLPAGVIAGQDWWWGAGRFGPYTDAYQRYDNPGNRCTSWNDGFPCTRKFGHAGAHMAGVGGGVVVAEWGIVHRKR